MVSHEKIIMWDILENEVPTCVLPTTLRIYSKVFITVQIYKTFVHSSGKNGRHVKLEKTNHPIFIAWKKIKSNAHWFLGYVKHLWSRALLKLSLYSSNACGLQHYPTIENSLLILTIENIIKISLTKTIAKIYLLKVNYWTLLPKLVYWNKSIEKKITKHIYQKLL
jgi:hypothetical protein